MKYHLWPMSWDCAALFLSLSFRAVTFSKDHPEASYARFWLRTATDYHIANDTALVSSQTISNS